MVEIYETALGTDAETLTWWQMSLRAVVVFFAALVILRIGNKRIFGKNSAFDIVLGIIYGSVLSRAVTGNSPFLPTLVAVLVLVLLHKGLAAVAFHSDFGFGDFAKGKHVKLVEEGKLQRQTLRKHSITEDDLREAMRESGSKGDLGDIRFAYLERSGQISVIMKDG
ncbi:DUF421 domain-containing protein [Pontibacter pamirensis]|uniref:DUF421 domain-containing protein n=1 Tax=Pontibacter pamirensis TaxID=2562824 RepID=UPI001F36116B|nr:YetF domain-containing protein [Pontibacter pamirensis]